MEVYCPVQEVIRQWTDRKKKIIEPLFKSYVFVFLDNYDTGKVNVMRTPGIVRFLFWLGNPGIVKNEEIEGIRDFLEQYKNSNVFIELNAGDTVDVKEGPLAGQSGTLISVRGNKAILLLKSLKMNLTAELPARSLTPAK